jgi:putative phosphoribosyl transferase
VYINEQREIFRDRTNAGQQLTDHLKQYKGKNAIVFAIPRGGIPLAMEAAARLSAPLGILVVRKIPIPDEPEASDRAITEDGTIVLNESRVKYLQLSKQDVERQATVVRSEIMLRSMLYRQKLGPSRVKGKIAIVIDDGLASGYTMIAAINSLKQRKASHVIVAVPVASGNAFDLVKPQVDDIIAARISRTGWFAVASYYQNWNDFTDEDVVNYLDNWGATFESPPKILQH